MKVPPPLFRIHNTRASPSAKAYFPHVRQTSTTSKLEPNLGDTRFISFVCTPCQLNDTSMDSIKKYMWLVLNYFTSFPKTFSSFSSCSLSFPLLLILCYNSCLSFSGARSSMRTRCARSSGRGRPTMSPWGSVPTMRAGLSSRSDIKLIQICFWLDFEHIFFCRVTTTITSAV